MNTGRDLKRKEISITRIQNLFAYQIRWQLINSNPSKCRRTLSNGTVIENCQVIKKNITILERKSGCLETEENEENEENGENEEKGRTRKRGKRRKRGKSNFMDH